MAHVPLVAQPRTRTGSAAARRLRREGLIPGVLYQRGESSLAFVLEERELSRFLHGDGARTSVVDLTIGDAEARPALVKEWQREPVRGAILHVDLVQVDLTETIQAPVALVLTGEAVGVREGGVLDQPVRELIVEALPDSLPDSIELDVSGMAIGDSARIGDLVAPEGVTIEGDPETVIASITLPTEIEEPEEEGDALADGEVPEIGDEDGGEGEGGRAESSDDR